MSTQPTQSDQSRLLAALAYPFLFVVPLIILGTDLKKDSYLRHHAWTGLFWSIAWGILYIGLWIVSLIPFFGWLFGLFVGPILGLALLILSIYYAIQAYNGKTFTIPLVSDWARKYATS